MSCNAKKDPNGTWRIQYRWTDWTGTKKKSQKRGFKTKKEAEEWYAHFMLQQSSDPTMTLADFWEIYKADMEKRLRKTTMKQKEYVMNDKVLPYFGKTPINEITAPMIRKWQGEMMEKGFKPTYLKTIHNQLSAILNYAVNFYDLRSNLCRKAGSMGKSKADERPYWTLEEFQKFSDAIMDKQDSWIAFQTICNDLHFVTSWIYLYNVIVKQQKQELPHTKGGHQMNYNTVYVGMDVHKESFSLCAYTIEAEKASHYQRTEADYKKVLNYLEFLRTIYGDDANFICGYEAGCLGYTLYHQLTANNVKCIILAPTTMLEQRSKKRIKTDKRDAEIIAKCLAQHNYSPVHIPTAKDEETKEFLRMRDDHKLALKKVKQQILAFCLRHNYRYDGNSHWTAAHLKWLKALTPEALYKEILDEYLLTYHTLSDKLERLDKRIEELSTQDEYKEAVKKLCCFIGVKTHTALSVLVEVGDFNRFASAQHFASYLGLVPGEDSSGNDQNRLGITKAGNRHVRLLLTEASQCYARGQVGFKSKELKARQSGNTPAVIAYADKANERLRRRYYKMVLNKCKKHNVAKTAIARELACFMWGMMTDNIA